MMRLAKTRPEPPPADAGGNPIDPIAPLPGVITQELMRWSAGDHGGRDRAYALAYPNLLRAATRQLAHERSDHTLDPRSLVAEVYLRLVQSSPTGWTDRRHFMHSASLVMRHVLVDHARARLRQCRGEGMRALAWTESLDASYKMDQRTVALDEALTRLHAHSPDHAELVVLSYFGGLTQPELAVHCKCSLATIERRLAFARAWLRQAMAESLDDAARSEAVAPLAE